MSLGEPAIPLKPSHPTGEDKRLAIQSHSIILYHARHYLIILQFTAYSFVLLNPTCSVSVHHEHMQNLSTIMNEHWANTTCNNREAQLISLPQNTHLGQPLKRICMPNTWRYHCEGIIGVLKSQVLWLQSYCSKMHYGEGLAQNSVRCVQQHPNIDKSIH